MYELTCAGLFYPMMTIIDYKGFRMIAMPLLPIDKNTIKYGSNDAGVTVHTRDETLNVLMKAAADRIHIRGHYTGLSHKKLIYGPGDIEAHLGTFLLFYYTTIHILLYHHTCIYACVMK